MNTKNALLSAVALVALGAAGIAQAGTLTPIASYVEAGSSTSVLGINNAGWMTGSVTHADGSTQGFSRDAAGTYTLFSVGTAGSSTVNLSCRNLPL